MTAQPAPQEQADAVAAVAVVLASRAALAVLVDLLATVLSPWGIGLAAAKQALSLTRRTPVRPRTGALTKSAGARRWTEGLELHRRAAYLVNAARRIQADLDAGRTEREARVAESRFARAHDDAVRKRAQVAARTDAAVDLFGQTLGWFAVLDDRTDSECRRLHGRNFRVQMPPLVHGQRVLPGMVHPHCRCMPGPPHGTGVRGWLRAVG